MDIGKEKKASQGCGPGLVTAAGSRSCEVFCGALGGSFHLGHSHPATCKLMPPGIHTFVLLDCLCETVELGSNFRDDLG